MSALTDLHEFCRLRDLNGIRLYAEEIERDTARLYDARLTRKRTNLRNWLKWKRLEWTGDDSWERELEIKRADKHFQEEDIAGRGRIRFIYENIQRVRGMYDALLRTVAQDGAA